MQVLFVSPPLSHRVGSGDVVSAPCGVSGTLTLISPRTSTILEAPEFFLTPGPTTQAPGLYS